MPTPRATAYETDIKVLRNRVNFLRTQNNELKEEVDSLKGALQTIYIWATVDNVLVTRHVVGLCEQKLGLTAKEA